MTADDERRRTRSPAYPSIDLEEAFYYAKKAYELEKRHPFTLEAAGPAWGYKPSSSAVGQIASALKQFGLLVEEPGNGVRRVKVSELAYKLIVHQEGAASDPALARQTEEMLQTAALSPKLHREIWDKYDGDLPSDASLRIYLLTERDTPFNKDQVDRFISQLRGTISYAKLTKPDKNPQAGAEAREEDNNKETRDEPRQCQPNRRRPMQAESGVQQATFPMNGGEALVQWPENLTPDEFEDFKDWLELVLRKVKRSVPRAEHEKRLEESGNRLGHIDV